MPNIFSCDPLWTKKLIGEQKEVVVIAWSSQAGMEAMTERVSELENEKIPVMVLDCDACQQIPESLGIKPGEVAVYKSGVEVGRVFQTSNTDEDVQEVRKLAGK